MLLPLLPGQLCSQSFIAQGEVAGTRSYCCFTGVNFAEQLRISWTQARARHAGAVQICSRQALTGRALSRGCGGWCCCCWGDRRCGGLGVRRLPLQWSERAIPPRSLIRFHVWLPPIGLCGTFPGLEFGVRTIRLSIRPSVGGWPCDVGDSVVWIVGLCASWDWGGKLNNWARSRIMRWEIRWVLGNQNSGSGLQQTGVVRR